MTENEKAATFVGWGLWTDSLPPDMTDPRNYMKALEGLPTSLRWTIGTSPRDGLYCRIWEVTFGKTVAAGRTVAIALAALWDVEERNARTKMEVQP